MSDEYVDLPVSDEDDEEFMDDSEEEGGGGSLKKKAKQHVEQLKRLQQKASRYFRDPEFYKYLEQFDKDLLGFDDDDDDEIEDDQETGVDGEEESVSKEELKHVKPITMEMVDSWCDGVENEKIGSIRSIIQAFRRACHYGEDHGDNSTPKFSVMSGSVLDKVMHFVLKHMDSVLRQLLGAPSFGGKKEAISELMLMLMLSKPWKRHGNLMRIYLANALHMITEMTDEQMIAFTIHRVRASAVFLAAFPSLLRKYVKALLHIWARGRGAMPLVSFMFLRDLCIQGIYKAYLVNCKLSKSISGSKLQHIQFLGNCVRELYSLDPQSAYQHAFVFIRQLGVILRGVLTERGPKVDKKTVKTRAFQEACIYSVVDELAKHLAQWSYSIAVFEMSFIPLVRLRSFCKTIKADKFRKEMKDLINQCVGAESSTFSRRLSEAQKQQDEQDNDEGTIAFSKNWLAENKKPKYVLPSLFFPFLLAVENTLSYHCSVRRTPKENKKRPREDDDVAAEEDRVEDLVLSSDEEDGNNQEPEDGFVPVELGVFG
ncbi:unnamed protein product [Miscanthus lutarioriparius]|uniref:Nucleolar complex protein 2 homolog n=1 Tax=Miscanthus lutarioriparius TaxID=422564 RepID=A0A811SGX1_9POAL|nr:unnamed protein product [Miscanthus lutarioriparius]